jgi:outer membrane immunogenic protein
MKHMVRSLGALAVAAVLVQPALAADLGRPIPKAPPVVAPVPSWYGFFIGVQAGYAWGNDPVEIVDATGLYTGAIGASIPFSLAPNPAGLVAGIRWGTNWQSGRWVYGLLSDFSYSDIRDEETVTLFGGPFGVRTTSVEQRLKWFGTTRVRGGYLVTDNLLLYASGGLADGKAEVTFSSPLVGAPCFVPGACPAGKDSLTRFGWAAGAGLEYAWGPWSVSLDYIHYDLARFNTAFWDGLSASFIATSTDLSGDMIRGAINHRFNWTVFDLLTGGAGR